MQRPIEVKPADAFFVYDPKDWDTTYSWEDRDVIEDAFFGELTEPREFYTLVQGPSVWAVDVVLTRDENGDPDEVETRWYWSERAAKRAAGIE